MSVLTYIASDYPLKEVENPHVKQLSINQALEIGIEVPGFLPSFDKDEPNVMLWIDDEENFGEISIREFCMDDYTSDIYTKKKYSAYLEWKYTESRAEILIKYIQFHLIDAEEIELWSIWLGEWFDGVEPIKNHHIHIDQLTPLELEKVFNKNSFEFHECIIVSRA